MKRPELKQQAQEWAGIRQGPDAELFLFIGYWSKQEGIDLIANVMPSLYVLSMGIVLCKLLTNC